MPGIPAMDAHPQHYSIEENLSGNDARAQIFQVRQQESKGIEIRRPDRASMPR